MSCKDGSVALVSWHGCLPEVMTVAALTGEGLGECSPVWQCSPPTLEPSRHFPGPMSFPRSLVMASSRCRVGVSWASLTSTAPRAGGQNRPLLHVPPAPFLELSTVGGVDLPG